MIGQEMHVRIADFAGLEHKSMLSGIGKVGDRLLPF
jgi:hypothetical protein